MSREEEYRRQQESAPPAPAPQPQQQRQDTPVPNSAMLAALGETGGGLKSDGTVDPAVQAAIAQRRGTGESLDRASQERLGTQLGDDFSDVRVHRDREADTLARSVSAKAFTVRNDVYFAEGEYRPGSGDGDRLLAHELTHVTQQRGAPEGGTLRATEPGGHEEREAERATAGGSGPAAPATAGMARTEAAMARDFIDDAKKKAQEIAGGLIKGVTENPLVKTFQKGDKHVGTEGLTVSGFENVTAQFVDHGKEGPKVPLTPLGTVVIPDTVHVGESPEDVQVKISLDVTGMSTAAAVANPTPRTITHAEASWALITDKDGEAVLEDPPITQIQPVSGNAVALSSLGPVQSKAGDQPVAQISPVVTLPTTSDQIGASGSGTVSAQPLGVGGQASGGVSVSRSFNLPSPQANKSFRARVKVPDSFAANAQKEVLGFDVLKSKLTNPQIRDINDWFKSLGPRTKKAIRLGKSSVFVKGQTSTTGDEILNQDLGQKRADAVVTMLKQLFGGKGDNIMAETPGKLDTPPTPPGTKPEKPGQNPAEKDKDRKVTILYQEIDKPTKGKP